MAQELDNLSACRRFADELPEHVEGRARQHVLAHALACTPCATILADVTWIQSAARSLPEESPSLQVWNRIETALAAERESNACRRFAAELELYLEGDAPPFVVTHANDCAPCHAMLADLQAIQVASCDLSQEEPAAGMWAKIRETLQTEGIIATSTCAQFAIELEGFLEGESRPFVPSHANECVPCATLLGDLRSIQAAAEELPDSEPAEAVWLNLRLQLVNEGILLPAVCAQFSTELEAYLEGAAQPFVHAHASECAGCGALLADLESLRASAVDLPQEEPSRAVWANVRARLEFEGAFKPQGAPWRRFFGLLPHPVPLGVLAGLTVMAAVLMMPPGEFSTSGGSQSAKNQVAPTEVASLTPPAEDLPVAHVVSDLESNFRASEGSMAPDLKATYEKSLVSLDSSIQECLTSMRQDPGNTMAHDYLLTAYTRKAEVLSFALEFEGR